MHSNLGFHRKMSTAGIKDVRFSTCTHGTPVYTKYHSADCKHCSSSLTAVQNKISVEINVQCSNLNCKIKQNKWSVKGILNINIWLSQTGVLLHYAGSEFIFICSTYWTLRDYWNQQDNYNSLKFSLLTLVNVFRMVKIFNKDPMFNIIVYDYICYII